MKTSLHTLHQQPCPCGSGIVYEQCCAPLHNHTVKADSAVQLMRSRYCAFVLEDVDYLIKTTSIAQRHQLDRKSLTDWIARTNWQRLEILDTLAGQRQDTQGEVEFKAWYFLDEGATLQCHHERSQFKKEGSGWAFIDPNTATNTVSGRNSPCPCGSGRKFKRCCGN